MTVTLEHLSAKASCIAILGLIKLEFHRLPGSISHQTSANESLSYTNMTQLTAFNLLFEVTNLALASVRPPMAPADSY